MSTTAGVAVKAPVSAKDDRAVIAMLDTGVYSVTSGRPLGTAGDERFAQGMLEAQRMAIDVIGPWQVDAGLQYRPPILETMLTGPIPSVNTMTKVKLFPAEVASIAAAHGYITGFSTARVSDPALPGQGELINAVLPPRSSRRRVLRQHLSGRAGPPMPQTLRALPGKAVPLRWRDPRP